VKAAMALAIASILLAAGPSAAAETGSATHYCLPGQEGTRYCTAGYGPGDLVAAIDRKDSGFDKGDRVRVTYRGRSVVVRIVDVCRCGGERIIDLTSGAFRRLAPLGRGVLRDVVLTPAGGDPVAAPTLPPTDQETRESRDYRKFTYPDPMAGWKVLLVALIGWRVLALIRLGFRPR
jgi:hypothetical protein